MWKEDRREPEDVPNLRELWKVPFHSWAGDGLAGPSMELVRRPGATLSTGPGPATKVPALTMFSYVSTA